MSPTSCPAKLILNYAVNLNEHPAYPCSLLGSLQGQVEFRPIRVVDDPSLKRPWVHFGPISEGEVFACSFIPTDVKRWILCSDHFEYLWLQHCDAQSKIGKTPDRHVFEANVAKAFSTTDCLHIFTWSQAAKRSFTEFLRRWNVPALPVSVLYPSVPKPTSNAAPLASRFRLPAPELFKLLMVDGQLGVCREKGRKNLMAGVECFHTLRNEGWPVALMIVGAIENLPEEEHLYQFPRLNHGELRQLYEIADLFLFLSRQDSFGYALLEALAAGTCCIATTALSLPAVSEIVTHGVTGYLVGYRDQRRYPEWSDNLDMSSVTRYAVDILGDPAHLASLKLRAREMFLPGGRFDEESRDRQFLATLQAWTR